jgi:hypothetical protein
MPAVQPNEFLVRQARNVYSPSLILTLKAWNKIAQGKREARHPGIKVPKRIRSPRKLAAVS